MVDAGNLEMMHKSGGLIKQLSEEDQAKVMKMIENAFGLAVPATRKGNAFHVEIEVKSEEHQGWSIQAKKGSSTSKGQRKIQARDNMEVDQVGYAQMPWAAFWEEEIQAFQRRA